MIRAGSAMEQAIQSFSHDVTELLPRSALGIGEWIVAELPCIPAMATKPLSSSCIIEEEPVFVINLWKERNGFGTMYGQDRTADEYILKSTGFPMPMAHN
jgi:hypothetical protein